MVAATDAGDTVASNSKKSVLSVSGRLENCAPGKLIIKGMNACANQLKETGESSHNTS